VSEISAVLSHYAAIEELFVDHSAPVGAAIAIGRINTPSSSSRRSPLYARTCRSAPNWPPRYHCTAPHPPTELISEARADVGALADVLARRHGRR